MLRKFDSEFIPGKVFEIIQLEMKDWQAHNFPGRESWMSLVGLGEELGELMIARSLEDIKDAIGDCCIYLADYCNAMGYNLQEINNKKMMTYSMIMVIYGKLCHAHLKQAQKIRMHENHRESSINAIAQIITYLNGYLEQNTEKIVWETWVKVRERDWQKNRDTAHEQEK